jgi:zinc transport system substrate-binding protein
MNQLIRISTTLLACLALSGCDPKSADPAGKVLRNDTPITVITSNYPLYYFASQIVSGMDTGVEIILPEIEGDPASWQPDSESITDLQGADLVVLNGAGYESWLGWVTLPEDLLLDTSASFADQLIPVESETVHQHGPSGEHSHKGYAFTVWLNPKLAIEQSRSIHQALTRLLPDQAAPLDEGLARLTRSLEQLDQEQEALFNKLGSRPVLFSHPVYQYLQARYGINGASVHWEPGEMPATSDWIELGNILSSHPAGLMLWEDTPLEEVAAKLLESGIRSVPFHTASNRPDNGDYLDVMRDNMLRLAQNPAGGGVL